MVSFPYLFLHNLVESGWLLPPSPPSRRGRSPRACGRSRRHRRALHRSGHAGCRHAATRRGRPVHRRKHRQPPVGPCARPYRGPAMDGGVDSRPLATSSSKIGFRLIGTYMLPGNAGDPGPRASCTSSEPTPSSSPCAAGELRILFNLQLLGLMIS